MFVSNHCSDFKEPCCFVFPSLNGESRVQGLHIENEEPNQTVAHSLKQTEQRLSVADVTESWLALGRQRGNYKNQKPLPLK